MLMLPVAILAGGLATRMRPITEKTPKSLIEVAGKPFISHQLNYLHLQGIQNIVLCVGYLGEMIQAIVGNGSSFGLHVSYSFDGSELQGTGGALRKALPLLGKQFFVLYGDSFLPINFSKVENAFFENNKNTLMCVMKNNNFWDKSNVLFHQGKLIEYNKKNPRPEMNYIDYGLGIMTSHSLNSYPSDKPFDLADVYHQLSLNEQLTGHEVYDRFYEIGSSSGLQETEMYFNELSN